MDPDGKWQIYRDERLQLEEYELETGEVFTRYMPLEKSLQLEVFQGWGGYRSSNRLLPASSDKSLHSQHTYVINSREY